MSEDPRFQIRLHLKEEFAKVAREQGMGAEALKPLTDILSAHSVNAETQLTQFAKSVDHLTKEQINEVVKLSQKEALEVMNTTGDIGVLTAHIVHKDDDLNRGKREKYSKIMMLDKDGDDLFTHTPETDEMLAKLNAIVAKDDKDDKAVLKEVRIEPVRPFHMGMVRN